jgi:hypothetical protein
MKAGSRILPSLLMLQFLNHPVQMGNCPLDHGAEAVVTAHALALSPRHCNKVVWGHCSLTCLRKNRTEINIRTAHSVSRYVFSRSGLYRSRGGHWNKKKRDCYRLAILARAPAQQPHS